MVLSLATFMQVCVSLPQQTPAALGPVLTHDLGLTRAELGLLTSASWGGMLLGTLPWGIFTDRRGERLAVVIGGVLLTAALFASAQSTEFVPLCGALLVAAVGAAAGGVGGARGLTAWFEPAQRGLAIGIRQTGVTFAGLLDALILPPIALRWGWPGAVRTVAVTILVGVLVFAVLYREPVNHPWGRTIGFRLRTLAANRSWLAATVFAWFFMGSLGCVVTYLVASLHQDAGTGLVEAGYLLAVLQVGGIGGRLGWGILSDRRGVRGTVMATAGGLGVLSCLAMAGLEHPGVAGLLLGAVALALGLTCLGWNALYITLTAESVPTGFAATAIGAGTTLTFTGLFVAPPVFGAIADHTGSYTWSWLALAGWAALGTLAGLRMRDRFLPARRVAQP